MVKIPEKPENKGDSPDQQVVTDFVNKLSDEHRMLIVLKAQLYGGSFEPMLNDLKNRLKGKPYIFKLVNRINEDIERIKELVEFEKTNDLDLTKYVEMPNV